MTKPQERIWVDDETGIGGGRSVYKNLPAYTDERTTEYVRADIHREAAMQYLSDAGQLSDRIDALEAALRFYAVTVADCRKVHSEGDLARNKLHKDGGDVARAALGDSTT